MVVTGQTKLKMGDTFSDMPNVTLITSIGLVYRWGLNLKSSRYTYDGVTYFFITYIHTYVS